jgi:hypothetical protein
VHRPSIFNAPHELPEIESIAIERGGTHVFIEASELFRVYRPVAEHQSAADAPQQYAPSDAALIAELSQGQFWLNSG